MNFADKDGTIYIDGEYIPWPDAKVHIMTHALHYGTGVFEGIRVYPTAAGPAIFRLTEHVKRILDSAHIMSMPHDLSHELICDVIIEIVKRNKIENGYIRPMIYYGAESIGLRAKDLKSHFMCAAWSWRGYIEKELIEQGISVKTSYVRRAHINSNFINAKVNGHYVNSMIAAHEAQQCGYDEALMLDHQGFVAEGPGENLFVIKDGNVFTPPLATVLAGITRDSIIQLCQDNNIPCQEKNFTIDEVYIADEAFYTGTAVEIAPIRQIDARNIGEGKPGALSNQIKDLYFATVTGENKQRLDWLTFLE